MKKISMSDAIGDALAAEKKGADWIIHTVLPEKGGKDSDLTNSHTHGMEKHGSDDFQLVMPYDGRTVGELLNTVAALAAGGRKIDEETEIHGLFTTGPARFARFRETGRTVLRMICPDENGKYPWDEGCAPTYADQLRPAFGDLEDDGETGRKGSRA